MTVIQRIKDFDDSHFDPFSTMDLMQGFGDIDDPYPGFRALHAAGTVHQGGVRRHFGLKQFPFWADYPNFMVLGYDMAAEVFADGSTYSNSVKQIFYNDSFGASIDGMDAPHHPRYRRIFQKAFLPQTVARWGKELAPAAINRLIDSFKDRGRAELVSEFTSLYPFHIIYDQLQMPIVDRDVFQKLAVGLVCVGIDQPHAAEASRKMGEYFAQLLRERGAEVESGKREASDLISLLAVAEVDGERLPEEISVSFLRQIMGAAGDTTFRVSGSLLVGLLTNPDQLEAVRRDRSLVPQAIEEALRWEAPITFEQRMTTRDIVLNGMPIPKQSIIDVVIGSANRDPARFENPDEFDIFRKAERHVTFASGPHVCIGQHLARLEMIYALNLLLDRLPNLRLDPEMPVPRVVGVNSRSPVAVHVLFD